MPTHARRPLCRLALLGALAGGCLALPATAGAAPKAPAKFFGISAVQPTEADYERIGEFGFGTYRFDVNWRAIEPERGGGYNWRSSDRQMLAAVEQGVRPLPILIGTPEWISKRGKRVPPVRTPAHRSAWKRFAATAYLRYGPGGNFWANKPWLDGDLAPRDWVVWNEQNARSFWHPRSRPGEYANLLRITRQAIKKRDRSARLIVGGMYGYPQHRKSLQMPRFLRKLYSKRGVKRAADGVSLHPYAGGVRGAKKQVRKARHALRKAGEGQEGIWIGEIGWASGGSKRGAAGFLVKSRSKQAKLLKRSYNMLLRKRRRWNVKTVVWYTWRNFGGAEICNWCPKAGLLERDSDPKPAAKAYRRLIERSG